jgi:hypothetical protein
MRLPSFRNRPRATAISATLVLHLAMAWWLLALRFELPREIAEELTQFWLPPPVAPATPLVPSARTPEEVAPITAPPLPLPPVTIAPAGSPDWSATAKEVAKDMTTAPPYRPFGEAAKGPEARPQLQYPPSIFDQPLPRVGKTVTTPDGETIIWVSDYCYVSIRSRSLTQKEIHDARKGVRTCILAQFGGEKKARDDLFDAIKRPPPPQESGCSREGVGQSCGR